MNRLQILDVFPYLHTAASVPEQNKTYRNLEVGGLRFILRKIISELRVGNFVICCFDFPTNKSNKLEGYKSNRVKDPRVIVQADLLWDILLESGIPCYRGHGEADDHIFGCVETFKNDEDILNIFINSGDYDLCHNLVTDYIEFHTVNSNSCCVNWQSFQYVLRDKEYDIPIKYNTISAYKVLRYDSSDHIPRFKGSKVSGIELYKRYVNFLNENDCNDPEITRNKELLLAFLGEQNLPENEMLELKKRADTIFPKDLRDKVGGYKYATKESTDFYKLANYCRAIGDQVNLRTLRAMGITPYSDDLIQDIIDKVTTLGTQFKNGLYQVDKSIPVSNLNNFASRINVVKGF